MDSLIGKKLTLLSKQDNLPAGTKVLVVKKIDSELVYINGKKDSDKYCYVVKILDFNKIHTGHSCDGCVPEYDGYYIAAQNIEPSFERTIERIRLLDVEGINV